jgi:phosphopantothenoylcysteine synthetase/decarboxylase
MSICGNYVELIENHKVQNDNDFIIWNDTNLHEQKYKDFTIEVYIEKKIIDELSRKQLIIIDATIGKVSGKEIGMLFIKPEHDKYGI